MQYTPTIHKLSNGVTVILDPMDLETTNAMVTFWTGTRDQKTNEYGLLHFCEHMLCRGTKRFPTTKDGSDYMDYNSGQKNASTGTNDINIYGRILGENLHILLDFLGDQIQNSLFDSDKIDIERKVIKDELRRNLDDSSRQLADFISHNLFNDAIGYSEKALGTPELIDSFTREQMLDYIARHFSARNCTIGISGKINNVDDTLACLEKTFSFLPQIDVPENKEIHYTPTIAHNSQPEKNNIKLQILFPRLWPITLENKYKNMCVGRLYEYMREKLYEIIRRQNGLTYGLGLASWGNEMFGVKGFATQTSKENIGKVVELIAKNLYQIYNEMSITEQDLDRINHICRLGDANFLESASARRNRLIDHYHDFGQLYDFYDTVKMSNSITRDDLIKNTQGMLDGKISIITQGADFDADLGQIWADNFR